MGVAVHPILRSTFLTAPTVSEADSGWFVSSGGKHVAGPFDTNAAAWDWIDRHTPEGRDDTDRYNRIRIAFHGGDVWTP
jgi:hypothetical protein